MDSLSTSAATIPALFDGLARERPDAEAAIFPDSRTTFAQLGEQSVAYARALRGAGVGHGDLVGLLVPADVRNIELLLAMWRLGAIPVPINGRYRPAELSFVAGHSGMTLLIVDPVGAGARARGRGELRVVVLGADADFAAGAPDVDPGEIAEATARLAPADDAVLLYTSGTTSDPKGAVHSHASLVAEGRNVAGRLGLTAHGSLLVAAADVPLRRLLHDDGSVGRRRRLLPRRHASTPSVALDQLERERCTFAFPAFEMIWLAVLDHPRYERRPLRRCASSSTSACPSGCAACRRGCRGPAQISSFGSTESCGFMCIRRHGGLARAARRHQRADRCRGWSCGSSIPTAGAEVSWRDRRGSVPRPDPLLALPPRP